MILKYALEESDHVTNQLFIASKSERVKKKRLRGKWTTPIVCGIAAIYFSTQDAFAASFSFFLTGVLYFFIYPIYERRHYIRHYQQFIAEHYRSLTPEQATITVTINSDNIHAKSHTSESRIAVSDISSISEIQKLLLIKLKGPATLIIPKYKLDISDELIKELKNIAARQSIPYNEELNWKWR